MQCVEQAASFIAIMEKNQQSIKSQLSEAYDNQVQLNTSTVKNTIVILTGCLLFELQTSEHITYMCIRELCCVANKALIRELC